MLIRCGMHVLMVQGGILDWVVQTVIQMLRLARMVRIASGG